MDPFRQAFAAIRSLAVLTVLAVSVSGCGVTGVELNGKAFEMLGVDGTIGGKEEEAKLARRGGLVIPPDTKRLPKPGEETSVATVEDREWPVSAEDREAQIAAAQEAKVKKMCANRSWYENTIDGTAVNPKLKKEFDEVTQGGSLCNPLLGGLLN